MVGQKLTPAAIAEAARLAGEAARPIDDIRGSAGYRRQVTEVIVRRLLEKALSYGGGGMKPELVTLHINGRTHTLALAPNVTLLHALRDLGYMDVKCGCEQGDCGACAVMLDGVAVNSCLVLAGQADGCRSSPRPGWARSSSPIRCTRRSPTAARSSAAIARRA